MTLDVAYSYCINLTKEQKLEIDKQVRKNRFKLEYAIFFPFLPVPIILMPQAPLFPVEGFTTNCKKSKKPSSISCIRKSTSTV